MRGAGMHKILPGTRTHPANVTCVAQVSRLVEGTMIAKGLLRFLIREPFAIMERARAEGGWGGVLAGGNIKSRLGRGGHNMWACRCVCGRLRIRFGSGFADRKAP